ncbi:TonB family protein, partial [Acidisphaera rubrifaciens]|uniref:TonB family protein n=1 Tax=Acidisphaera rubrifaciens TaxID=50715 RepID=UPI00066245FE
GPARPSAPQREAALMPPLMRPGQRPSRAPSSRNGFPAPMNYSFGPLVPSTRAPRSIARSMLEPPSFNDQGDPGAGERTASSMMTDFARVREGNPGPDFYASLRRWWLAHRFYPPEAVERGEDGDVQLALIVDSQGRVTDVEIEGRSGSMYLDMAGESVWRDAQLLPPPDSMHRSHITVDITLHYQLIR